MRHATQSQRLSLPTAHRQAVLRGLVRGLVMHGQIRTTHARAKAAQRLADRLVTLGKEGSVHSRRRAFGILQDRTLVKQLFAEIATRYLDVSGGYTRVVRLSPRPGDGAERALLALSRLPAAQHPVPATGPKGGQPPQPSAPKPTRPGPPEQAQTPKKFFEGLRSLWTRKKNREP